MISAKRKSVPLQVATVIEQLDNDYMIVMSDKWVNKMIAVKLE